MDHYLYTLGCRLDVPYRNLQSHFIHDILLLQWKEPFISKDRQALRVANNGGSNAREKQKKTRSQRFYVLRSLGWVSLATNSYFRVMVYHVILYTSTNPCCAYSLWSYSVFINIGFSLIQLSSQCGTVVIHSPIAKGTHNKGLQDTSSPAQLWQRVLQLWENGWSCVAHTAAQ